MDVQFRRAVYAAALLVGLHLPALAQTPSPGSAALANTGAWPSHPITVVSPFAPGTMNDLVAHAVLDPAGADLGQPFVIVNRPGGDGTVGVAAVVHAAPDGYTLLLSTWAMAVSVILHKSLPYDVLNDLEPVGMLGGEPYMLMAAPGKGYADVASLVAAAKAKPGTLKFGSVGVGSAGFIAGERFRAAAGLDVVHVAYPGPTEALTDLAAGRVDFYFVPVTPALPLITEGRALALAVSTPMRLPSLSGLQTLAEAGYPVASFLTWMGLSAPAKTPRPIIDRLNAAIAKAIELPTVRGRLLRTGVVPITRSPEEYARFIADDVAALTKLAKDAHIEPTQ